MFVKGIQRSIGWTKAWGVASSLKGGMTVWSSSSTANNLWMQCHKRYFSNETKEYINYILQQYTPPATARTKAEIIRDLNAPKLSNERVDGV